MVSIIIPVYNREKTIERAVKSVLEQTYQNIEVIVVDDCSTDNTINILYQIIETDKRVKLIALKKQGGACVARNTGIQASEGEIIAFQDSDDEWLPDKLQIQLEMLEKYSADICFCQMYRFGYHVEDKTVAPVFSTGIVSHKMLCSRFMASTQTIIAKRQVFEDYQFDKSAIRYQDFDWIVRASEKYTVLALAKPLVNVFLQSDSISVCNYEKLKKAYEYYFIKYNEKFINDPELYIFLHSEYANFLTVIGENCTSQFLDIYKISGNKKHYIQYLLSKFHLLALFYKLTNKYQNYKH